MQTVMQISGDNHTGANTSIIWRTNQSELIASKATSSAASGHRSVTSGATTSAKQPETSTAPSQPVPKEAHRLGTESLRSIPWHAMEHQGTSNNRGTPSQRASELSPPNNLEGQAARDRFALTPAPTRYFPSSPNILAPTELTSTPDHKATQGQMARQRRQPASKLPQRAPAIVNTRGHLVVAVATATIGGFFCDLTQGL